MGPTWKNVSADWRRGMSGVEWVPPRNPNVGTRKSAEEDFGFRCYHHQSLVLEQIPSHFGTLALKTNDIIEEFLILFPHIILIIYLIILSYCVLT